MMRPACLALILFFMNAAKSALDAYGFFIRNFSIRLSSEGERERGGPRWLYCGSVDPVVDRSLFHSLTTRPEISLFFFKGLNTKMIVLINQHIANGGILRVESVFHHR